MNPTSGDLGAAQPATIATAFAPPIDTWADMSHLLAAEHWTPGDPPESLQYLCGVLPAAPAGPPVPDPSIPAAVHDRAGDDLRRWLDQHGATLWPAAADAVASGFDDAVLYPASSRTRSTISSGPPTSTRPLGTASRPSVQSTARPTPGGTGLDGLVVVGDWVRTGLGYGCIEAAVMGGLAGARAITGDDIAIYGETDFAPFRGPWASGGSR